MKNESSNETKKNVDNKTTVLTQEEIETRLNKLMGKDLNHQKNNLPTRSVVNNADDLIKQVKNEVMGQNGKRICM